MAYFVIIGIGKDTKEVIDEIKKSHQSSHIVSAGSLLNSDSGQRKYEWTIQIDGTKIEDADKVYTPKVEFKEQLANQIAEFNKYIPDTADRTEIFVIAPYLNAETDYENIKFVTQAISEIKYPFTVNPPNLNIILLGYDISRPKDVTKRPQWRLCKKVYEYLNNYNTFNCKVLYINNQNLHGSQVELSARWLAHVISDWIDATHCNPSGTLQKITHKFYSIGVAEYRYSFEELIDYFETAAKYEIIQRRLNSDVPTKCSNEAYDANYIFETMDWYDGLKKGKQQWDSYANKFDKNGNKKYDYSKSLEENRNHNIYFHKNEITDSLIQIVLKFKDKLREEIHNIEIEITEKQATESETTDVENKKNELQTTLNTIPDFKTLEDIRKFNEEHPAEKTEYDKLISDFENKSAFFIEDRGKRLLEEASKKLGTGDDSVSRPKQSTLCDACKKTTDKDLELTIKQPEEGETSLEAGIEQKKKNWFRKIWYFILGLFGRKQQKQNPKEEVTFPTSTHTPSQPKELVSDIMKDVNEWVETLSKILDTKNKYEKLCKKIDYEENRLGNCANFLNGYSIDDTTISHSLIDFEKVKNFRNSDFFKLLIKQLLYDIFENEEYQSDKRESENEFIERLVIQKLRAQYEYLDWDDNNHPFVDIDLFKSDEKLQQILPELISKSDDFINSTKLQGREILVTFYSSFNTPTDNVGFTKRYQLDEPQIVGMRHDDFRNILCVIKTSINVNAPEDIYDFIPKSSYPMSATKEDYYSIAETILNELPDSDRKDKIKAIYDWLCKNIKYDTTGTIHDADGCIISKIGVCQAYCEVFLKLAGVMNIPVEIVTGYVKTKEGTLSEEKHSWIYAFTKGYEGIFIDPTWGAGSVIEGVFYQNPDTSVWFDVSPEAMIYTHFPDDAYWKMLEISISKEQFEKLPFKEPNEVDSLEILLKDLSNIK